ncbi:B12-binding domain-containing radical SAM protein [Bacteroides fragilis]|uniref:B12-binding domain-containing radical SAM protein n=1 Tax=Bacteroides fragilis TaxID=817 RepID=UPI00202F66AA|nr:radical SAM protein [Bacteroides fragilis]MCM0315720.1 radical SAM protein [Bacteroides fragilis]
MNILLNCFPPTTIYQPDLGLSVLKQYLQSNNIECDIIYWNILFDKIKKKTINQHFDNDIIGALLPFFAQLYPKHIKDIEFALQIRNPSWNIISPDEYNAFLLKSQRKINNIFNKWILSYNILEKYTLIGLPYRFLQWVPGLIFITKLKQFNPNIKFVMGGFNTKYETVKFMESVDLIDYGIWGEGEIALTQLCEFHFNNEEEYPINVQSLVYKNKNGNYTYNNNKTEYTELVTPDFSDFFRMNKQNKKLLYIPIERSRGCSWKKCMFCYLNDGYKFRKKSNDQVIATIDTLIKRHNIRVFNFNDNDLVCSDLFDLDDFLNKMIKYKSKKKIEIWSAEINSKLINENILKKFQKAGFKAFQIGIEALSDSKLSKIKKESSFINHLYAIKFCVKHKIRILGANIIMGFPDDTNEDIKMYINNLHYLRYYFSAYFSLSSVPLNVKYCSKYYKKILSTDIRIWESEVTSLIDHPIILNNKFYFFGHINKTYLYDWEHYNKVYSFYSRNNFKYKLNYDKETKKYEYIEILNDKELYTLEFDKLDWKILRLCDSQIVTKEQIYSHFETNRLIINKKISRLIKERIIYQSEIDGSLLSIINL